MARVVDMVHGRQARAKSKNSYTRVEGRWRDLCCRKPLIGRILWESMKAQAICGGLVQMNPALISVVSLHSPV